jgi:hypothetical protein
MKTNKENTTNLTTFDASQTYVDVMPYTKQINASSDEDYVQALNSVKTLDASNANIVFYSSLFKLRIVELLFFGACLFLAHDVQTLFVLIKNTYFLISAGTVISWFASTQSRKRHLALLAEMFGNTKER